MNRGVRGPQMFPPRLVRHRAAAAPPPPPAEPEEDYEEEEEEECYEPFTGDDSFLGSYAARLANLVAGVLGSASIQGDAGPQLKAEVNVFGIKPSFTAGIFNFSGSLTGAGNLTGSVTSPMPGNLTYAEASLSLWAVKVGAARNSVTEGISTRTGPFTKVNEGFSGMAKATAWKSNAGKISAHLQVFFGAKAEVDFGAALQALDCALTL